MPSVLATRHKTIGTHRSGICLIAALVTAAGFACVAQQAVALQVIAQPQTAQAKTTPPDTTQQTPTVMQVVTRRVSIDVVVTDGKDKPVRGLTRNDFKVFEDGVQQATRSFDPHVLEHEPGPPHISPGLQLPPNTYANLVRAPEDGPVTVILYDVLNTPTQSMAYAHEAMVKFIKNQPPGSRTAIFVLGDKLHMLEGFTDDDTRLLAAINSKSAATQQSSLLLNSTNSGTAMPDLAADNPQVPASDSNTVGPTSILGQLNSMEQMEELMQVRERLYATVEAFAEIGRFLSALPGRKNLLWLSGSFPGSVLPSSDPSANGTTASFGMTLDADREIKIANDLLNAAHVSVYPVDVRGLQVDPIYSGESRAKISAGSAPKMNTFLSQNNAEHSTMDEIANNTGGHAFYNTNGLGQAMQTAMDQGSVYYTLTYSPTNAKFDGSMRHIRIELSKPGYQLSYRRSYFADTPVAPAPISSAPGAAAPDDPMIKSMRHGAPISTELFFEATVLPQQGPMQASPKELAQLSQFSASSKKQPASEKPLMVQHYEVDFTILGRMLSMPALSNGRFDLGLTFALAAFDGDGLLQNGLEITVKDPISAAEHERIKGSAYRTKLGVALPLDARWIRIAVRDSVDGHTGTIEIPVPASAGTKP